MESKGQTMRIAALRSLKDPPEKEKAADTDLPGVARIEKRGAIITGRLEASPDIALCPWMSRGNKAEVNARSIRWVNLGNAPHEWTSQNQMLVVVVTG